MAAVVRTMSSLVWTAVTDLRRVLVVGKPTASYARSSSARIEQDVQFTQRAVCEQPDRTVPVGPAGEN
jgi:hypothetical protein